MSANGDASAMSKLKMGLGRGGAPSRKCAGRSVIRREYDGTDERGNEYRKGDPVLDYDNARTYRPCNAWAANGTEHCGNHGGSAPQTIAAAKRTLALSAHDVATALIQIANDSNVPPETRVKAQAQVLDRIGIRLGVDVSLEVPKWQKLIGKMFGAEAEDEDLPPEAPAEEPAPAPAPVAKPKTAKAKPAKTPNTARPKFQGWA